MFWKWPNMSRLSREVVKSSFLKLCKTELDTALTNLLWLMLLKAGVALAKLQRDHQSQLHLVMLEAKCLCNNLLKFSWGSLWLQLHKKNLSQFVKLRIKNFCCCHVTWCYSLFYFWSCILTCILHFWFYIFTGSNKKIGLLKEFKILRMI